MENFNIFAKILLDFLFLIEYLRYILRWNKHAKTIAQHLNNLKNFKMVCLCH